jgi:hypothetical protein
VLGVVGDVELYHAKHFATGISKLGGPPKTPQRNPRLPRQ